MANVGMYHPGVTLFHQVNPLTKLALATSLSLAAFMNPELPITLSLFAVSLILLFVSGAAREVMKSIFRFLIFFIVVLFIVQSLWWQGESALWHLGPLTIKQAGFYYSLLISSRLLVVLLSFYALMYTTHPSDLVRSLEQRGLSPRIAYVILATLQAVTEMQERAMIIMEVQQCRGVETKGNLLVRAKAYIPLIGPLIVGSVLSIESRALALEVRGFSSTQAKTQMETIHEMPWERWARYLLILLPFAVLAGRLLWK